MEAIPEWVGTQLTPWGIVVIIALLVLTGGLRSNREFKSMEQEKEHWRAAAKTQQETNRVLAESISKQEIASETVSRFMSELQEFQRQQNGGGDSP